MKSRMGKSKLYGLRSLLRGHERRGDHRARTAVEENRGSSMVIESDREYISWSVGWSKSEGGMGI